MDDAGRLLKALAELACQERINLWQPGAIVANARMTHRHLLSAYDAI